MLDVERDPASQGFAGQQFDVVLASNVLHAAADLRAALRHVRDLLAPGGLLVLVEGTARQRWANLVFGLTDGWWRLSDTDLRRGYPLLGEDSWRKLLDQQGYVAALLPESPSRRTELGHQAIILARRPSGGRDGDRVSGREPNNWLIFADKLGIGHELAELLAARGDAFTLVYPSGHHSENDGQTELDPARPADFERFLRQTTAAQARKVIYLWGLDVDPAEDSPGSELLAAQARGCAGLLHLTQALARNEDAPGRLWAVTRGAQPASDG